MIEIEAEEQAERGWSCNDVPPDQVLHRNSLGRAGAGQRSLYTNVLGVEKNQQREGRHASTRQFHDVGVVRV